ncbi:T-kininogen 1 isoform X2 [Xenopus laevis]|uniref:T-kininogen 1 isoform X2 n=1 Tax=Xenopus laevis TaxID=8355 RepID=A0A8J1KTV4_XENLA|nr:T-kininogen 1 isoform X2 [Xenopus laevis]
MKHLFSFIFFLHLLRGSASQTIEADCNDHNIFYAVDEALRHHNKELIDGNQFVLYRITEARIKTENGGTHNFVSYDIREGSCGVKSGKVWQNCDFKQSDEKVGKCSAHIVVNKELKTSEVIIQNCSTFQVEPTVSAIKQDCLGCPINLDTRNKDLLPLIKSAIEKMNKLANYPFYFDLENIIEATLQVVAGWNYRLIYTVRQTNCSKSIHSNVPLEECDLDANGQNGTCTTQVFKNTRGEIIDINLSCFSQKGFCLSCPDAVDVDDPELLDLLRQVMDEYNSYNNNTNLYNFVSVDYASKKGVHEKTYDVTFNIKETNCSKSDYAILGEECQFIETKNALNCDAKVNVTDTKIIVASSPICNARARTMKITNKQFSLSQNMFIRLHLSPGPVLGAMFTYKGLSPFRGVLPQGSPYRIRRDTERAKGPAHGNKGEQKHVKKHKKEKKDKRKKKNGHKNEDSSEESQEYTILPTVHATQRMQHTTTQTVQLITSAQKQESLSKTPGEQISKTTEKPTLGLFPHIPSVPEDQDIFLNFHDDIELDLPEPDVSSFPKCPGKPWEPVKLPSTEPTYDLFDLASAIGDATPTVAENIENKVPGSTSQGFNDEDLLLSFI